MEHVTVTGRVGAQVRSAARRLAARGERVFIERTVEQYEQRSAQGKKALDGTGDYEAIKGLSKANAPGFVAGEGENLLLEQLEHAIRSKNEKIESYCKDCSTTWLLLDDSVSYDEMDNILASQELRRRLLGVTNLSCFDALLFHKSSKGMLDLSRI